MVQDLIDDKQGYNCLVDKVPRWSEKKQTWVYDFGGRVSQPSVKNTQLVIPEVTPIEGNCSPEGGRTETQDNEDKSKVV